MQLNPRALLLMAAALSASIVLLVWYQPLAGFQEPEQAPVSSIVPAHYAAWPSFVMTWRVEHVVDRPSVASVLSSKFGADPCGVLRSESCLVRLAWGAFDRWSLTASGDPEFDPEDPTQFTVGPLHYAVDGGVVLGVLDTDRLPRLHVCHRLAEDHHSGKDVTASLLQGGEAGSIRVVLRSQSESAVCEGTWGIPTALDRPGQRWESLSLELRSPTDDEIGNALVQPRLDTLEPCQESISQEVEPATQWLADLASGSAGYQTVATGAGVEFPVRRPAGPDQVIAWTAADEPSTIPPRVRSRALGGGLVATELLEPAVLSIPAGGLRVWLTFDSTEFRHDGQLEHDLFVLGMVAERLAGAVGTDFQGPRPPGNGVFGSGLPVGAWTAGSTSDMRLRCR